jgi:hypothetical protein
MLLAALVAFAAPAPAQDRVTGRDCGSDGTHMSQHSESSDGDRKDKRRVTMRWRQGSCQVELEAEGDFTLRTDLTDIDRLSPGGTLEITERRRGERRRLEIDADDRGTLTRRYSVNGDAAPWDAEAQRWLSTLLLDVERHTAFAASTRVPALLARGGSAAVLDEITRMSGDHAKRRYYTELIAADSASGAEALGRVLEHAGQQISSDYELAEMLVQSAKRGRLADRGAQSAYVRATASIGSDYEHRRALNALLLSRDDDGDRSSVDPAVSATIFAAAKDIASDYEAAELLIGAARRGLVRGAATSPFFDAVDGIGSDYERRRTLSALVTRDSLSEEMLTGVLRASGGIRSDYERAELLIAVARRQPALTGALREAYLDAADRIRSDHERNRAVAAIDGRRRR